MPSSEDRAEQWWVGNVIVPLISVLVGGTIGIAGGVVISDRQADESKRQLAQQIRADRRGRLAAAKTDVYGNFLATAHRHFDIVLDGSIGEVKTADRELFAALRLVQLRGSVEVSNRAVNIAARARKMTNRALLGTVSEGGLRIPQRPFLAQQRAVNRFTDAAEAELD